MNGGEDTASNQTEGKRTGYRVVGLVDAQDEDELREEERGGSVVDYARLVAMHGSQTEEEDGGEEEEAQRHSHGAPRQDLDGENLAILMSSQGEKSLSDSRSMMERLGGDGRHCAVTHLPPGDIHEHGKAGHVITLTTDVGAVSENHLAALRRPATLPGPAVKKRTTVRILYNSVCSHHQLSVTHSQYGVVPEDTDGFGALLGGGQAELHGDGFVQSVLQQLVIVVDRDADHRRVDDRTLWHPDDR